MMMTPKTPSPLLWLSPPEIVSPIPKAKPTRTPINIGNPGATQAGRCSCAWSETNSPGASASLATS